MFEWSVALRYLIPRRRQLSASIIGIISLVVVSIVVWLILVFFSITTGLEHIWTHKLITLTAPIRVTPTDEYYRSYYHLIDTVSSASGYANKTIGEKAAAPWADPYDPEVDMEPPSYWPAPDLNDDGTQKDLVKEAYRAVEDVPGLEVSDYQYAVAQMKLRLLRSGRQHFLTLACYLSSLDDSGHLGSIIAPPTAADTNNVFSLLDISTETLREDAPYYDPLLPADEVKARLNMFFDTVHVSTIWLPPEGVATPHGRTAGNIAIPATVSPSSLATATTTDDVTFSGSFPIGDITVDTEVPASAITLADCDIAYAGDNPWFFYDSLPTDPNVGRGVLATKHLRDNGVLIGDRGFLSYFAPNAGALQEQRIPIFIAGFYDPGILPLGGKFVIADKNTVALVNASSDTHDTTFGNGINVWTDDIASVDSTKAAIVQNLADAGLSNYWDVQTYKEYEFSRDLVQQLQSEKLLFTLVAIIIMVVACSNIISMLIILVNDKKKEIGILQSMGASRTSIASIFAICGITIGIVSAAVGTIAAYLTLVNIDSIMAFLSALQGHAILHEAFYGNFIPNTIDWPTFRLVIIMTGAISLLAGTVPAIKACLLKPAEILRSE